jgi:hypothetical protein
MHANAKQGVGKIQNVELLGAGKMKFTQNETALTVQLPGKQPSARLVELVITTRTVGGVPNEDCDRGNVGNVNRAIHA